ncbi:hypothetical protein [Nocardioides sp. BYT-33-1]|uniref:hypothetical protein n=1 Tax=Nocardioides sp. BYT-33-1 TaxID=3416952 RepID=UPI003F52F6A9
MEIMYGPIVVWSGTLEEPDWDQGSFVASGASRDAETAMALDGAGASSTEPNTIIDAAIVRGVLSWTRVGNFGTTPIGDANGGLVTIRSVLDAWAQKNGSRWKVNRRRELVIEPIDISPRWFIVPGAGFLGAASQDRVDRVFARFINSATGRRDTVSYPATTPSGGIESAVDLIAGRGAMTSAAALAEATNIWNQRQGLSSFTNGATVAHGQVAAKGGDAAELALIEAGESACMLGSPDPRGIARNTTFAIGETEYDWEDDEAQLNPADLAPRDTQGVLESVGNLALDAMAKASTSEGGTRISGVVTVAVSAGDPNGTGQTILTFPTGTFTAPPRVLVSSTTFAYYAWVDSITATQCRVLLTHINATPGTITAGVNYIAMGW